MCVIVSVDATTGTRAAIRLAAREARYRDCPLVAIAAYTGDRPLGASATRPVAALGTADDVRAETDRMLAAAVADALGDRAAGVRRQLVRGLAGRRFVEAVRDTGAELIVLTARGSMSLLLGAVSQYVLRHAPCPVLVVPEGTWAGSAGMSADG